MICGKIMRKNNQFNGKNIHKLARIVCTIGPASNHPETLVQMINAGMDLARLNFSHGSNEEHKRTLAHIRAAEEEVGRPIAVLQDLCGPKIRVGKMANGAVELIRGQEVTIQADMIEGNSNVISLNTPQIVDDIQVGEQLLLDDGLLELKVEATVSGKIICRVVHGGILKSHKGVNLPHTNISLPSVTEKDKADLEWGLQNGVDYVALSFVRCAQDVLEIKEYIQNCHSNLKVVAKIEKPEAVASIEEIIKVADAIMIARGDMGVEMPKEQVPWIQRRIIDLCAQQNKPVITATQMLESMTKNSRPTRAEVTDVTVAIMGGTDAVMLSGETAIGIDPVSVVKTMSSIIKETEKHIKDYGYWAAETQQISPTECALINGATHAQAKATMIVDYHARKVVPLSKKDRSKHAILITDSLQIARQSALYHSVIPIILDTSVKFRDIVYTGLQKAKELRLLETGDLVAVIDIEPVADIPYIREGTLSLVRA
jgi:pyruvate kinase